METEQKDPSSYFYKVEDIIIHSELERSYNKPPNLRCMNYVYGYDLMAAISKRRCERLIEVRHVVRRSLPCLLVQTSEVRAPC